jgi:hypothetical protein
MNEEEARRLLSAMPTNLREVIFKWVNRYYKMKRNVI